MSSSETPLTTDERCVNWPCQGVAGHSGPCGSYLCETCDKRPCAIGKDECQDCIDNRAERACERSQSEGFRGGEAAAYHAERQAGMQRELKR